MMAGVERLIEGTPGEEASVWVQDRGGGPLRLRGRIVIEDLTGVLTAISSRSGANGPQNPVTQYMLARAANHLADRLIDGPTHESHDSVPRVLSGSLGHQPFVEQVLEMSQHQMLRRWPLATDWYTDVINYIVRPARFGPNHSEVARHAPVWSTGTFGEFVRRFGQVASRRHEGENIVRVAEALQQLWPDYPPVRDAMAAYRAQVIDQWLPLYRAALQAYGLRLRPGLDETEIAWAINALNSRETLEKLADMVRPHIAPGGTEWSLTAWLTMVLLAGALTDADGRAFGPLELCDRQPVIPLVYPPPSPPA